MREDRMVTILDVLAGGGRGIGANFSKGARRAVFL
jgi:hypothetical protein